MTGDNQISFHLVCKKRKMQEKRLVSVELKEEEKRKKEKKRKKKEGICKATGH